MWPGAQGLSLESVTCEFGNGMTGYCSLHCHAVFIWCEPSPILPHIPFNIPSTEPVSMSSAFQGAHDFTFRDIHFGATNYHHHGSKAAAVESEPLVSKN